MAFSLNGLISFLRGNTFSSRYKNNQDYIETISTSLPISSVTTEEGGGGLERAVAVAEGITKINGVAVSGDSVKLPTDVPIGYPMIMFNAGDDSCSIFSESGYTINGVEGGEWSFASGTIATAYKISSTEYILAGTTKQ